MWSGMRRREEGQIRRFRRFSIRERTLEGMERAVKHVEIEIEQRLHAEEETLERLEKITGVVNVSKK
jgi:hypothetical protein